MKRLVILAAKLRFKFTYEIVDLNKGFNFSFIKPTE